MFVVLFSSCLLFFPLKADSHSARRVSVEEGDTLTLKCVFPANDESSMQWATPRGFTLYFNDQKVLKDRRFELIRYSKNRLIIRLSNVTVEDEGMYSCLRYSHPTQRRDINVTVLAVPTKPVLGFTLIPGSSNTHYAILNCFTSGCKPPPKITWLIDNTTEVYGKTRASFENNGKKCNATSTLRINAFTYNSTVTCIVRHKTLYPGHLAASFAFHALPAQTPPSSVTLSPIPVTSQDFTAAQTPPSSVTLSPIPVTSQDFTGSVTSDATSDRDIWLSADPSPRNELNVTDSIHITAETVTSPHIHGENVSSAHDVKTASEYNVTNNENSTSEFEVRDRKSSSVLVMVMVSLMVCVLLSIFYLFLMKLIREHSKWRKENEISDQTLESARSRSDNEGNFNQTKTGQVVLQSASVQYTKEESV
ncbi:cytotoxic and regulatory T-cell molecule [Pelobates fuscus]|uniref:cytotoxic and regulatory T-cell molecule n=1 Tax=Pelobates fuscus TaxID=191477 RepID=UPI002FE436F7